MEQILENKLLTAAAQIEKHLDSQLERLDNMNDEELRKIRESRLKEMKEYEKKKQEWLNNGHGIYTELSDEKEFFEISKKSPNIVCHFYKDSTERCRIVDMHLKLLSQKHIETKFCKINAEKSPFLTQRLRIKYIPTIALIKDSKTKDYIIGFQDLGNRDDFSTDLLEWRIAQSGAIDYKGDLLNPPEENKKSKSSSINQPKKVIRGGYDSDDSDIDFD